MKQEEPLEPIVARCRWLSDAQSLLSLLPQMTGMAPPIERWPVGDGRPQWVSPVTGLDPLVGPLIEAIERAKSQEVDSIVHAQIDIAKADLLVAQLVNLLRGLSEKQVGWALMGVARWSTAIVSGDPQCTDSLSPSLSRRVRGIAESIGQSSERGVVLTAISDAISARVSAALRIGGQSPSGLVRKLVVNRLVWVVPHKDLDPSVDLPWVANMLGLPLEETVVQMVHKIAHIAIETSRTRLGTRKERPADALLAQLLRPVVGDPLMNVSAGPAVIRALSHLVEAKHLKGRVSDPRLAVRYLDHGAIRTVSGAWTDLVECLGEWDVLAAAIAGCEPVSRTDQGWRLDRESLDDSVAWSLRIPRARPQRAHTVVAVRMLELLEAGGGGDDVRLALQQRWKSQIDEGVIATWVAEHGIAVFACAAKAIRFASRMNRTLVSADGLLAAEDESIALPPGMRPSVGVATGLVVGGWDGESVTLDGPALARAMGRCGGSKVSGGLDDPLQIRRVSVGPVGIASHGVTCGRTAMLEALNRWGQAVHRYGDNSEVSGISRDFTTYPVDAWAPDDSGTTLFLSLGRTRGAEVVEALWVDVHMLRDLQVRDRDLAEGGDGMLASESPSIEVDDPFDGSSGETVEADDPFGFEPAAPQTQYEKSSPLQTDWGDIGFGDDDGAER